ncbi:ferredoxin [Candidatus Woesearchaeota archaeon]|nr:ferredoxin [Candidatus Woesearchaeota archaeon]
MTYIISLDKEKCIGCGACAANCDNFEMEESKATVKKAEVEEPGCNQEVAEICPVEAIKVEKR